MFVPANANMRTHTRTDVHITMHTNMLKLESVFPCKEVGMHAAITNEEQILQMCDQTLPPPLFILVVPRSQFSSSNPALCRCVRLLPHFTLPRSLSCARTKHRGFKQERQRLSIRLACSRRHKPLLAPVTICLEVPVEVH